MSNPQSLLLLFTNIISLWDCSVGCGCKMFARLEAGLLCFALLLSTEIFLNPNNQQPTNPTNLNRRKKISECEKMSHNGRPTKY